MSERTEALAARVEQVNAEVVAPVERCSDEQWLAQRQDEGWPWLQPHITSPERTA